MDSGVFTKNLESHMMHHASETDMMYASDITRLVDKSNFIFNIGLLLTQTREGVIGCYLADKDTAVIVYNGGHERRVNIAMDSYLAIIKDIAKAVS